MGFGCFIYSRYFKTLKNISRGWVRKNLGMDSNSKTGRAGELEERRADDLMLWMLMLSIC
jgi:hypothetical protein